MVKLLPSKAISAGVVDGLINGAGVDRADPVAAHTR